MGNGFSSLALSLLPIVVILPTTISSMMALSCRSKVLHPNIGALLLDFDGTICETEKAVTLEQFNQMFKQTSGLEKVTWSSEEYGELLLVGASQARLMHYFDTHGWPEAAARTSKEAYVDLLKRRKDDMFDSVWAQKQPPPLPGIVRLIDECLASGQVKVGVVSNSNLAPVTKMCLSLLGPERVSKMVILAGDMPQFVKRKKPDPLLYLSAAKTLGVAADRCVCVEDSNVGLLAAKGAGMQCIVTPSYYTRDRDDFSLADVVVDDLDSGYVHLHMA